MAEERVIHLTASLFLRRSTTTLWENSFRSEYLSKHRALKKRLLYKKIASIEQIEVPFTFFAKLYISFFIRSLMTLESKLYFLKTPAKMMLISELLIT